MLLIHPVAKMETFVILIVLVVPGKSIEQFL